MAYAIQSGEQRVLVAKPKPAKFCLEITHLFASPTLEIDPKVSMQHFWGAVIGSLPRILFGTLIKAPAMSIFMSVLTSVNGLRTLYAQAKAGHLAAFDESQFLPVEVGEKLIATAKVSDIDPAFFQFTPEQREHIIKQGPPSREKCRAILVALRIPEHRLDNLTEYAFKKAVANYDRAKVEAEVARNTESKS